jgi:hypothetical protein
MCDGTFSVGLIPQSLRAADTVPQARTGSKEGRVARCTAIRLSSWLKVKEAGRFFGLHTGRERRKQQRCQPILRVWRSIDGALEQTVTEDRVRLKPDPH